MHVHPSVRYFHVCILVDSSSYFFVYTLEKRSFPPCRVVCSWLSDNPILCCDLFFTKCILCRLRDRSKYHPILFREMNLIFWSNTLLIYFFFNNLFDQYLVIISIIRSIMIYLICVKLSKHFFFEYFLITVHIYLFVMYLFLICTLWKYFIQSLNSIFHTSIRKKTIKNFMPTKRTLFALDTLAAFGNLASIWRRNAKISTSSVLRFIY